MVSGLYFLTFFISATVLMTMLIRHRRAMSMAVLFSLFITCNSLGRFLISVSQTLEMAVLGNLMVYIGACYCPLLVILLLNNLCKIEMSKWVSGGLIFMASLTFCLVLTIGHTDIYYSKIWLSKEPGFSYLGREYGPAHTIYPLLTVLYMVVILGQLVYALKNRGKVTIRTIKPIVIIPVLLCLCYLLERVTKSKISYLSFGFLITMLVFMRLQERVIMYDMPTNILSSIDAMKTCGYVEFDEKYRLIGYNRWFSVLFPQVEDQWKIDEMIPKDDSFLYKEIITWMYSRTPYEKKIIQVGSHNYEMYVRPIPYHNKPCVGYLLELVDKTTQVQYMNTIQNYNKDLKKDVEDMTRHISRIRDKMVIGIATMVESRDNSTGDHIKRTYGVMKVFIRHLMAKKEKLGVNEEFLEMVARAAPMHDLGKIAVDDAVLRKKGKFTPEEFEEMKKHSEEGAKIVHQILEGAEEPKFARIAENVAHYHHEKWNGQGYPAGLKGKRIPLEARLMALADVFDALVSKRCYKDAYSFDRAFGIIKESLGTHFDPVLGKYFLECRKELEELYRVWIQEDQGKISLNLEERKR